ncbi:hypothetical protein [Brevundimonas sp.]|uniref:hypothetical protein n=1 Tax=Brevundimonas sp. TaxID=1871086 RepID=UPI002D33A3F8|nr:hypothetical protein [Brevundimonas sp.]HYD29188.1 hypothetical protein [Brevundimonas sp.]
MTAKARLIELDAYHLASGHVHRWYLSLGKYRSRATDTPAALPYLPLVGTPAAVSVALVALGEALGATRVEVGRIELSNALDWQGERRARVYDVTAGTWLTVTLPERPLNLLLTDYALAGWPVVDRVVEAGAALSTAAVVFRGVMEMPEPARGAITIPIRTREADFDDPVLRETYSAGDGADLEGRTKERHFGHGYAEPTYLGVIGGKHTYSVNGAHAIEDVAVFWDSGARLTKVTSGTPGASEWKVDPATGIITLGGTRPSAPMCEVKGDKTGGVWRRYAGELAQHLAVTHTGVLTLAEVDTASVATLDATPRTMGLWLAPGDGTTGRQALDGLLGSLARGYWLMGEDGKLSVGRLPAAAGAPAATYVKGRTTPGLQPRAAAGRGLPAKAVTLRFARIPTPAATLASSATEADAKLLKAAWRESPVSDPATAAAYKGARTVTIETALFARADADAEAAEFLADLKRVVGVYDLPVYDLAPGVTRRSVVAVDDDVAGFEGGRLVTVIGKTMRSTRATLTVRT